MELTEETKKRTSADYFEVAEGVWGMRILFVNIYMIKAPHSDNWVLIDAGLNGSAGKIIKMAESIFGKDSKPSAIILTHGHFDHVGAIEKLLEKWDVPVYAHPMEIPYLDGTSSYPPPDPTVGGGLMSLMSWTYPKKPINIGGKVQEIHNPDEIPFLPEWKFIHTPGHSPGHISFFRGNDRLLIAGDAFVTTKQESAISVMTQKKKICGPPSYFTPDWPSAYESVKKLAALNPEIVATGHGKPFFGEELHNGLDYLSTHFYEVAVPHNGRYSSEAALADHEGVQYVPPLNKKTILKSGLTIGAGVAAAALAVRFLRKNRKSFNKNTAKYELRD